MITFTLIIPTYNRPDDLGNCLASVLAQTKLPQELIVVDDGALDHVPFWDELTASGVRCRYMQKETPGLTESRNMGVTEARGEVIFFLDDDVILESDYLEQIMKVYENDAEGQIGGVGGAITNKPALTPLRVVRRLWNIVFLVCGWREGRVLPSGFGTDYGTTPFPLRDVSEVDFLDGGVSSFRRQVFEEFSFTDAYRRYGFGEDKDFTYRVSRRWKLMYTPFAKLVHLESSTMRPDMRTWGRKFVIGRWLFFRDYLKRGPLSIGFFVWALFGYALDRCIIAVIKRAPGEWLRVRGILDAANLLMRGRLEP